MTSEAFPSDHNPASTKCPLLSPCQCRKVLAKVLMMYLSCIAVDLERTMVL